MQAKLVGGFPTCRIFKKSKIDAVPFSIIYLLTNFSGFPLIFKDFKFMNPSTVGIFYKLLFSRFKFYSDGSV